MTRAAAWGSNRRQAHTHAETFDAELLVVLRE